MRKLIIILILFVVSTSLLAQKPFNKGINLTNWFQENSPEEINFRKYTKKDFENIKSLGCDVIRLPISLHAMADSTIGYEISPLFFALLDSAVTWAEELNITLILDNHTFNPFVDTEADIKNILLPVWRSMAVHYKDRSSLIYYEILNEPHGISFEIWNGIQQDAINAIREIDSVHTILVGSSDWNGYEGLKYLPEYEDTNLIYTFHFYDPFLFTHQGADWVTPSLISLTDMPFPYNQSEMPNIPSEYVGTWIEYSYNDYNQCGTEAKVRELIKIATDFRDERNVKIFCGEFGVYRINSDKDDRVEWYSLIRKIFDEENIPWTSWDYQYGFGIFEKDTYELFEHNLNIPLIEALGFNVIPQTEYVNKFEIRPLIIYDDFIGNRINYLDWFVGNSKLNFYSSEEPANGKYSIAWSDAEQYDNISFDFYPNKNFNFEGENNPLTISFWIKGDTPGTKIDVRFMDTKTDVPEDHPWRMRHTIDETSNNGNFKWDNTWQKISIPFAEFVEQGSWDNEQWYEPIGEFDWNDINNFQIVAEHHSLAGRKIWIDDIIIESSTVSVNDIRNEIKFNLEQNYPNPFNPSTTINYSLPNEAKYASTTNVVLKVYDILGREVATLVNREQQPGNYSIKFDATQLTSGIYFYKLIVNQKSLVKKLILLK